jgi:hypothetical protein
MASPIMIVSRQQYHVRLPFVGKELEPALAEIGEQDLFGHFGRLSGGVFRQAP